MAEKAEIRLRAASRSNDELVAGLCPHSNACPLLEGALDDGKTQAKRKFEQSVFVRGDSAYCQQDVIKTALAKGTLFTFTAHDGTTGWKDLFEKAGLSWTPHSLHRHKS